MSGEGDVAGKDRPIDRQAPVDRELLLRKYGLDAIGSERHSPKGSVDEPKLRTLVSEGASLREITKQLDLSLSTVRYWVGRLGLETERMQWRRQNREARRLGLRRIYRRCAHHGHTAFYARPDGGFRCVRCNQEGVVEWRRNVKRRLIKNAGGACVLCGYHRFANALHFHHLDPQEKEFNLSRYGATRSFAEASAEAAKCVLLCANCHAEVEGGFAELPAALVKVKAA